MEWGSASGAGFMASWPQLGVPMGLLLSTALVQLMSAHHRPRTFVTWGWRVPFLVSLVLVGVGLYVRLRVLESPEPSPRSSSSASVVRKLPVIVGIPHQWREILTSIFVRMSEQAPFYLFITFVLTYGTTQLKALARLSCSPTRSSPPPSVSSACRCSGTSPT